MSKSQLFSWVAVVMALAACSAPPQPASPNTAPLSADTRFVVEGRAQPRWTLDVAFNASGPVAEVLVRDGDTVTAGQVLARLGHATAAQAELARAEEEALAAQRALDDLRANGPLTVAQAQASDLAAESALETAQQTLEDLRQAQIDRPADERPSDLQIAEAEANVMVLEMALAQAHAYRAAVEQAGLDPNALAAAEARLTTAQAARAAAQTNLANLELVATHAGTVVNLNLAVGQRVAMGQVALTLADFSVWEVRTENLTELQVVNLAEGQTASLVFDALPDLPLSAEVVHINAHYEEKRGDITYAVTLRLAEVDPRLRWGMTAAIEFAP